MSAWLNQLRTLREVEPVDAYGVRVVAGDIVRSTKEYIHGVKVGRVEAVGVVQQGNTSPNQIRIRIDYADGIKIPNPYYEIWPAYLWEVQR